MICPACTGTGMESTDPEDASTCLRCNGSGVDPTSEVVHVGDGPEHLRYIEGFEEELDTTAGCARVRPAMKNPMTEEVTMSATQQKITDALKGAGFILTTSEHFPARTTWGGQTTSAERLEETWEVPGTTIWVEYDKRGQLRKYSYSSTTGSSLTGRSGGASVRTKVTKRQRGTFSSAEARELLLRTIDELATGCTYRCDLVDGKVVWVRYES